MAVLDAPQTLAAGGGTASPPAPRGAPQIELTFEIDVDGIVSVAFEHSVAVRRLAVHPSGGLSQVEVSRLWEEARERDLESRPKDTEAVLRQLDGLVANTMRSVQALEGKLTSEEQEGIFRAIEDAKRVLKKAEDGEPDADDLKERLAELEKAATIIGQAMLRS